jgi:PiT family inorganic phosphate transporter
MTVVFVVIIFFLSIVFTWSNGFQHASAIAAVPFGSHAMSRKHAVLTICLFEILGALLGGSAVADAVRSLSKWPLQASILPVLTAALTAATVWNFVARKLHQPASSTHSLLGAMVGALIAGGGISCVEIGKFDLLHPKGLSGILVSLFLSPLLGAIGAYIVMTLLLFVFYRASNELNDRFGHLQYLSTAMLAYGDGQNDTQKTMGLMVLTLNAAGLAAGHDIPFWIRLVVAIAMGIGAFSIGPGLVNEIARHLCRVTKPHAFATEISAAAALIVNSLIGGPASGSQVVAASVVGAAMPQRLNNVHWLVVRHIMLSWLITIPVNALAAALLYTIVLRWFLPA